MDYIDHQYGQENNLGEIEKEIHAIIKDFDEVYLPLGFLHHDHDLIGSLKNNLVRRNKGKDFYIYFDLPYYADDPILATEYFKKLTLKVEYIYRGGDLGKKMLAVSCYKSQVPITNLYHLMVDERYYHVEN